MGTIRKRVKAFYANSSIKAKINIFVVGAAAIIFMIQIVAITAKMRGVVLQNAEKAVVALSQENAYRTLNLFNKKVSALTTLAYCFESQNGMGDLKFDLYDNMITEQVASQQDLFGIWYTEDFMYGETLELHQNIALHKSMTDKNALLSKVLSKSNYDEVHRSGKMVVSSPFELDGSWVVCITQPIVLESKSVGAVGYVIKIDFLNDIVDTKASNKEEACVIISDNGIIAAHPDAKKVGKSYDDGKDSENILDNIKAGTAFQTVDYSNLLDQKSFMAYTPIPFDETSQVWSLCTSVPVSSMLSSANKIRIFSYLFLILSIFMLVMIINYFSKLISNPIIEVRDELATLAEGKIDKVEETEIKSADEIGTMVKALNDLKISLKNMSSFAKEIGRGNLDIQIEVKDEHDVIGLSLMDMQKNLSAARKEQEARKKEDEIQNWKTVGIAKINELVRTQNASTKELCDSVLHEILTYSNIIQGGIYVVNDNSEEGKEKTIDLVSCIAYNRMKMNKKSVAYNEGLLGRCLYEKQPIILSEVPDDYLEITSGLGDRNPSYIAIIPLVNDNEISGVMEFASFNPIDETKLNYLEKSAESLCSAITNARTNERTQKLLEKTKEFAEEVSSQEEELRQNMEEMHAAQEEMERKSQEYEQAIKELKIRLGEKE